MLRASFPEYEHDFLDAHSLLTKTPADAGLANLSAPHVVAAWSMGTLLAHQWMEKGLWPCELPLLSLNPIFRFIRPEGVGEPIILRMEEKLNTDREAVLRDFWRRMPKAKEIPPEWERMWLEGAQHYSHDALLEGLEFLRTVTVEPGSLHAPHRWELLAGNGDLLALPLHENSLPAHALYKQYAGGHLPFWECPDAIHASLDRLTR